MDFDAAISLHEYILSKRNFFLLISVVECALTLFLHMCKRVDMDSEKLQRLIVTCCMGGALCVGGASWAQQARVTSLLQVSKVTVSAGKASLSPAGQGKPGDLLEYRVRYDNHSHAAIQGLQAQLSIPAGTTYVASSALPAGAEASTDGVHFAPMPLLQTVRLADGRQQQQAVPLEAYRALRWRLGALPAGKSAEVSARVHVNAVPAAAAVRMPAAGR